MSEHGWIGVDLDGTLAEYHGQQGEGHIGAPVLLMVERVKQWLAAGQEVRIFTARVTTQPGVPDIHGNLYTEKDCTQQRAIIEAWCAIHLGAVLLITATKDSQMIELWDDRCVQVVKNTGERVDALVPVNR